MRAAAVPKAGLQPGPVCFGVYVHIPYCVRTCPYCDFPKYETARWPEDEYVSALLTELRNYGALSPFAGGLVTSIYFGGGTPSLFQPESLARVIRTAGELWSLDPDVEITVEANPTSLTADKVQHYRVVGVNRLSIGVQSFDPRVLRVLGRDHTPEDVERAIYLASAAGFRSVSVDFMYAVPGQSVEELEQSLRRAVELGAQHISAYALTFKPGTRFQRMLHAGQIDPVDEATEQTQWERISGVLEGLGFEHYEVSNFARPRHASRHNRGYWWLEPYLGVGAGACGFARPYGGSPFGLRWRNHPWPPSYMARVRAGGRAWVSQEVLDRDKARLEYCMLALRCADGIEPERYRAIFACDPEDELPQLHELARQGFLRWDGEAWRVTKQGMRMADELAVRLG